MRLRLAYALALGLILLPFYALAEAPVVDDSENFALLNEQQVARTPVATPVLSNREDSEEIALVQDNELDSQDSASVLNKIKRMEQEIQELRGQLELQSHHLKLLQQQQLVFYKDMDARVTNFTSPLAPKVANHSATKIIPQELTVATSDASNALKSANNTTSPLLSPFRRNPVEEQISYLAAYDLVKSKRFDEALAAMQQFVATYPQGGYTANAQYWLGELYIVKKEYTQAITHFNIVLKKFPTSSKAAACSLKIGYALASCGKKAEAKKHLQQVLKNYPDTHTAELAMIKLQAINAS